LTFVCVAVLQLLIKRNPHSKIKSITPALAGVFFAFNQMRSSIKSVTPAFSRWVGGGLPSTALQDFLLLIK
jgi:hypothetical protein